MRGIHKYWYFREGNSLSEMFEKESHWENIDPPTQIKLKSKLIAFLNYLFQLLNMSLIDRLSSVIWPFAFSTTSNSPQPQNFPRHRHKAPPLPCDLYHVCRSTPIRINSQGRRTNKTITMMNHKFDWWSQIENETFVWFTYPLPHNTSVENKWYISTLKRFANIHNVLSMPPTCLKWRKVSTGSLWKCTSPYV